MISDLKIAVLKKWKSQRYAAQSIKMNYCRLNEILCGWRVPTENDLKRISDGLQLSLDKIAKLINSK